MICSLYIGDFYFHVSQLFRTNLLKHRGVVSPLTQGLISNRSYSVNIFYFLCSNFGKGKNLLTHSSMTDQKRIRLSITQAWSV